MSPFTTTTATGGSRLSVAKIAGIVIAVIGLVRAFGIELPAGIEDHVTAIITVLGGLGIWGIRRAQD